jgi:hypothetical protein
MKEERSDSSIDLYWLPLGAGGKFVRFNGRLYEALKAGLEHRSRNDLYHAALEVRYQGNKLVVEMTPVWNSDTTNRGVVCEGPVGAKFLGHSRLFRYEIRLWENGIIPDAVWAVDSPQRLSSDEFQVARLLKIISSVPRLTWGRDEIRAGDMWNSNSVISWLLSLSGVDLTRIMPPDRSRAPGWDAGLFLASQQAIEHS